MNGEGVTQKRRDKLDIMLKILDVCRSPIKKTHILYAVHINFYQIQNQFAFLLEAEMLEETVEHTYRTTEKGLMLIKLFEPNESVITPVIEG